jgi:hypothetical protein
VATASAVADPGRFYEPRAEHGAGLWGAPPRADVGPAFNPSECKSTFVLKASLPSDLSGLVAFSLQVEHQPTGRRGLEKLEQRIRLP